MSAIYDYIITKPELNEDTLAHYGVKGMRWRNRKKGKKGSTDGDKNQLKAKRVYERIMPHVENLGKRYNVDFQEHVSDKYSKHRTGSKHKSNATSGGTTLGSIGKFRNGKWVGYNGRRGQNR